MTRKEAIKKWEDYLNKKKDELLIAETRPLIGKYADGNHRANCIAIYQNLIKLVEQVVNDFKQIDEPKWHKVSEEGLPTEEGIYIAHFCDSKYPELCFYFKENCEEIWNWEGEGLYWLVDYGLTKIGCCKDIIAWQKITPYEG